MTDKTNSAVIAGLTLGIVFVGIALIPYSRWYPLILPILGGAFATYLAGKKTSVSSGEGFRLGAKTGFIAGLIIIAVGAPITYLIVSYFLQGQLSQAETQRGFLTILVGMLIPAAIVLVLSIIGGVAAVPVFGKRAH